MAADWLIAASARISRCCSRGAAEVAAMIDLRFPPGQPFEIDPGFHPADEAGEEP